jgi:peptide/nickel transport system permease protein
MSDLALVRGMGGPAAEPALDDLFDAADPALAVTAGRPAIARRDGVRWGQLLRRPTFVVSVAVVLSWVVAAIAWRHLVVTPPDVQRPFARHQAPSAAHWFGTDSFGRDVLSRVLAGSRQVLLVAPLGSLLAVVAGSSLGLLTGYRRGRTDAVVMRTFDVLQVFPTILPLILLVGLLGRSTALLVVVIGVFFTPLVTRTVRAAVLAEREQQYVEAAQLRGESTAWILFREILPNVSGPIIVEGTLRLAYAIFLSATLSFIGLGAAPGSPEWGAQVADNRAALQLAWWAVTFPALAIATLVIAVTLIADNLREVVAE